MRSEENIIGRTITFTIRHLAAIVLVFVVAGLFGSSHFFAARLMPTDVTYHPVTEAIDFDEGAYYAVRAASVFYRGDWLADDISLKENFSSPAFLPMLNPLIIAGFGKMVGSLDGGFILAEIILSVLSFFLIYLLGFEVLGSRLAAILLASVFLIIPKFALFPSVGAWSFDESNQLYFTRFEYPMVTFPFFAAALYLLARTLKRNENWTYLVAGAAVGVLFYTYLYDWVYIFTGLFILLIFFLIMGKKKSAVSVLKIAAIAAVVAVPYWLNFFAVKSLVSFNDLAGRIGVELSRKIRLDIVWFSYIRAVVFAALVWLVNRRRQPLMAAYIVAFVLPILFLLNIQVLTGFVPQPDHWQRTTFLMLAMAVFAIVLPLVARIKIKPVFVLALVAFSTGGLFGYSFNVQYLRAPIVAEAAIINYDYEKLYQWFLKERPKSIILSLSSLTNNEAIVQAGVWTFLPNGFHTIISNEEITERAKMAAAVYGLSSADFIKFLEINNRYLFVDTYRGDQAFNSYFRAVDRVIPPNILDKLKADYSADRRNLKNLKFSEPVFVIFGPRERDLGANLPLAGSAELVYTSGQVAVYQIGDE